MRFKTPNKNRRVKMRGIVTRKSLRNIRSLGNKRRRTPIVKITVNNSIEVCRMVKRMASLHNINTVVIGEGDNSVKVEVSNIDKYVPYLNKLIKKHYKSARYIILVNENKKIILITKGESLPIIPHYDDDDEEDKKREKNKKKRKK